MHARPLKFDINSFLEAQNGPTNATNEMKYVH